MAGEPSDVRIVGFPGRPRQFVAKALDERLRGHPPSTKTGSGRTSDDEFEIATSFFGWNGNECSGLVLLDDRVTKLPVGGCSLYRAPRHPRDDAPVVLERDRHRRLRRDVHGRGDRQRSDGSKRLDEKYGRNAPLIVWDRRLELDADDRPRRPPDCPAITAGEPEGAAGR